ncbi:hypothetical protein SAMN03159496_04495 [Rhizobium sp. NFR07]|uniref:hypothetical protein n=1 Tax=Rhizobium sp. NFR07 TaxID=1566262 RepID=UPI0008ED8B51|nr:hypothetical protein [Rhizobium sp. NFR07]SFB51004.1 hypothetical protein SAMN03159496_04495 [Rhizobium sp. NFR07]
MIWGIERCRNLMEARNFGFRKYRNSRGFYPLDFDVTVLLRICGISSRVAVIWRLPLRIIPALRGLLDRVFAMRNLKELDGMPSVAAE